jgi:hypothetical protein
MKMVFKIFSGLSLLVMLVGCGGAGGSSTFAVGKYDGTVVNPGRYSELVEVTISSNGDIHGLCTLLSSTSGAISARAVLTGKANLGTGSYTASGMYESLLPPPPDGTGSGAITISGALPAKGEVSGPLHVDDNGFVFHGQISPSAF